MVFGPFRSANKPKMTDKRCKALDDTEKKKKKKRCCFQVDELKN